VEWVKYSINCTHLIAIKIPESSVAIRDLYDDLLSNLSEQPFIIQQVSIAIYKILKNKSKKLTLSPSSPSLPSGIFELLIPKLQGMYREEIFNDNSDAKQAILWLISHSSLPLSHHHHQSSSHPRNLTPARLKNLMDKLASNFSIDSPKVEMEILKSLSKCYLDDPKLFKSSFKKLIDQAKSKGTNINIRDRAWMYERMLELDIDQLESELSKIKEQVVNLKNQKEEEEIKWDHQSESSSKEDLIASLNNTGNSFVCISSHPVSIVLFLFRIDLS